MLTPGFAKIYLKNILQITSLHICRTSTKVWTAWISSTRRPQAWTVTLWCRCNFFRITSGRRLAIQRWKRYVITHSFKWRRQVDSLRANNCNRTLFSGYKTVISTSYIHGYHLHKQHVRNWRYWYFVWYAQEDEELKQLISKWAVFIEWSMFLASVGL